MKEKQNLENEEIEEEKAEEQEEEIICELEKELESKEKEIESLTNALLRLKADFSNYKNRVAKEKESTVAYALEGILFDLLPILDNFERALGTVEEKDGFYDGVNMIYEQFVKTLNDNGLQEIKCLGEGFDPKLHHAVFAEESEEEEGIVLEAIQKGYLLNAKVIRPSMVKVAK